MQIHNTPLPDLDQYTLILAETDRVLFLSQDRGVTPLLQCLDEFSGFSGRCTLYDRVIGLAAARLIVLGGFIFKVVTRVISQPANDYLTQYDMDIQADLIVPGILNRLQSGICPAETIAMETDDIGEMLDKLQKLGLSPKTAC